MGPFKMYVTCTLPSFIPLPISHFVSFTLSAPLCYSLKIRNYGKREKKIFVCMAASAYRFISKEIENRIMDAIVFLDINVSVNNLILTK